jgi:hypothetical protein
MENDINNLDPNDEGLKGIFGERFHDATQEPPRMQNTDTPKEAYKPARKPMDAPWEPVKSDPNWLDNLKACAKHTAIFGGLSFLVFYWQQAGLMDSSIAVPTMCICTALAGWGCGRNVHR